MVLFSKSMIHVTCLKFQAMASRLPQYEAQQQALHEMAQQNKKLQEKVVQLKSQLRNSPPQHRDNRSSILDELRSPPSGWGNINNNDLPDGMNGTHHWGRREQHDNDILKLMEYNNDYNRRDNFSSAIFDNDIKNFDYRNRKANSIFETPYENPRGNRENDDEMSYMNLKYENSVFAQDFSDRMASPLDQIIGART